MVATLGPQREKFWGVVLALTTEGLSISGTELASFEDFVSTVKEGAAYPTSVVFFPMHRIERIEMDLPVGNVPSLSDQFATKTGLDPATVLSGHSAKGAS